MHKQIYNFLESHGILYEFQFGFRPNNSTLHSLIQITEKIKTSIENGKFGCGIFIDLKKAFDTVNHQILIKKLEHYGIRGTSLQWFKSYLSNRQQFVSFNGYNSDKRQISCGVPQGSVLGPLLFLIYINDLPNISKVLNFYLFADDTNIYYESTDLINMERVMNEELKKLYQWLCANKLSLNISKTNFLIFHSYNKPLHKTITLKINNKAIKEEKYVKYLGILIDSTLSWKFHINELGKKVSRVIGVLYKIRQFVTEDIMICIYYSLIYPYLIYGIPVWGSASKTLLTTIHIIQKKIVRLITYNDDKPASPGALVHTPPLFYKLNILNIFDVFKLELNKFTFSVINGTSPSQFHNMFIQLNQINSIQTRSSNKGKLYIHYARTTHYGLTSIRNIGARLWNSLPDALRMQPSKIQFNKNLKKYFLSLYNQVV